VRNGPIVLILTLVALLARAEDVDSRQNFKDTTTRLHGVTTLLPMGQGGLMTVGGSSLRVLPRGAKAFVSLHRQPGDNLYRVAANDAGGVLAAWEKDPSIHLFTAAPKRHLKLAKPPPPSEDLNRYQVDHLAFLPDGRNALVMMAGDRKGPGQVPVYVVYRLALDGSSPPELLYRVDAARKLDVSVERAVFLMFRKPQQSCDTNTCPVDEIVVFEHAASGVTRKSLFDGRAQECGLATKVWGSKDAPLVLQLRLARNQRALLRWQPGQEKADLHPLPKGGSWEPELYLMPKGDVVRVEAVANNVLTVHRFAGDGSEQVITVPTMRPVSPYTYDPQVHDIGTRQDGRLWIHWGDDLLLFSADLSKPPRAYDLEPLLTRRATWAGVDVYLADPELLWVGIELGAGRDFVRLSFADMEKRSKTWAVRD